MVCDSAYFTAPTAHVVLILVLMEYGLRLIKARFVYRLGRVLILVLMEYGLRRKHQYRRIGFSVLILVLMEYGLRRT